MLTKAATMDPSIHGYAVLVYLCMHSMLLKRTLRILETNLLARWQSVFNVCIGAKREKSAFRYACTYAWQVCEHRWRMIANMAAWRNAAGGEYTGVDNWWDNGNNQVAFSRNGAAFIAFNTEVNLIKELFSYSRHF